MVIAKGFWSGETLEASLRPYITPFSPDRIDGAAYTLAMGRELYVSPGEETVDPQGVTIRQLKDGEGFTIPPGQFAFLLTEEIVEVPNTAMALISIKARIKWRGLMNVSGFHVDPGFKGRLVFAVQNAGPVPVHLRQGQPLFLIWYATLDKPTSMVRNGPVQEQFPPDLISGISGEIQSLPGLNKKIKDLEKNLTERVHGIEREHTYYRFIGVIVLAIFGAMVTTWVRDGGPGRLFSPPPAVATTNSAGTANATIATTTNTTTTVNTTAPPAAGNAAAYTP